MKNLNYDDIQNELKKIENVNGFDYWKFTILEHIENTMECGNKYNITKNDLQNIVENIFANDEMWESIDFAIGEELQKYIK